MSDSREPRSCTSVIVGRKASLNGSVFIARNEDFSEAVDRKVFMVHGPSREAKRRYHSDNTKVSIALPEQGLRYTSTPSRDPAEIGEYGESSINEAAVAVSATESIRGNERVLAHDPLVPGGIAEDAILDITAPFIRSAREGVEYLGALIKRYGSAEGNGVLFADTREAWYMEIPTGHHFAAVRIPDDCCAVAPNQCVIGEIDLNDTANVIVSDGIREFVDTHHLNPDFRGFNFRHIFGTADLFDQKYNTPRAWYAHQYLTGSSLYGPESHDIPFLYKPNRRLSVEDIAYVLGSHYQGTPYDPLGTRGSEEERTRYRSIGLSRTQESHILELRPECRPELAGIHWVNFATPCFTPYVPFFAYVEDTPEAYREMPKELSLDNAYWCFKVLSYLTEQHFRVFGDRTEGFLKELAAYSRKRVFDVTEGAEGKEKKALLRYLTRENKKTSDEVMKRSQGLVKSLLTDALSASKLSFKMDKNL